MVVDVWFTFLMERDVNIFFFCCCYHMGLDVLLCVAAKLVGAHTVSRLVPTL